jgi:hypothetical protein
VAKRKTSSLLAICREAEQLHLADEEHEEGTKVQEDGGDYDDDDGGGGETPSKRSCQPTGDFGHADEWSMGETLESTSEHEPCGDHFPADPECLGGVDERCSSWGTQLTTPFHVLLPSKAEPFRPLNFTPMLPLKQGASVAGFHPASFSYFRREEPFEEPHNSLW